MSRRSLAFLAAGALLAIPTTASAGVLRTLDAHSEDSPGAAVSEVARTAPRGAEARELGTNHGEAVREAAHDRSRLPETAADPHGEDGEARGHGRPDHAGKPDHAGGGEEADAEGEGGAGLDSDTDGDSGGGRPDHAGPPAHAGGNGRK